MPFKKGKSGNPAGRPRGTTTKPWTDAVRLAAMRVEKDEKGRKRRRLNMIADAAVRAAMQGDMAAVTEIANRLEGKVTQPLAGDPDGAPVRIEVITGIDRGDDSQG